MESVPGRARQWTTGDIDSANTHGDLSTEVVGTIPEWLSGCLYRNGAGVFDIKDTHIKHFFDGFSVIHKFTIENGKVKYASSLLNSCLLEEALGIKRTMQTQDGPRQFSDPCKNIFKKAHTLFPYFPAERTDNTSVNIVQFADSLYALTETATINKIDPESLQRTSMIDMTKVISVHSGTAHPHFGTNGDMYSYGTSFDYRQAFNIVQIPKPQGTSDKEPLYNAQIVATVPSRWQDDIAYNHSFGMSENYFVILDQPVTFNVKKFRGGVRIMQGVVEAMVTKKGEDLVFNVIDRRTNKRHPVTFETDSAFAFHFINCYEEDNLLIVDLVLYHRIQTIFDLYLDSLRKLDFQTPEPGYFARFVLPLHTENIPRDINLVNLPHSKATAIMEFDSCGNTIRLTPDYLMSEKIVMELPRFNYERYAGRKYRYAYGTSFFTTKKQLVKVDTEMRTYKVWKQSNYYFPGEPVFVPSPEAKEEDDGVILSPVLCETLEERSFLLILDARTFTEIARAYIPRDVKMCMTFHGSFCMQNSPTSSQTEFDVQL